jgi:hypothetical protein
MDFKQRLDWDFKMIGHEGKRQYAEGNDSILVITSLGK